MPFHQPDKIRYLTSELLEDEDLVQAIFTRHGGLSPHPWSSLNVGGLRGDDPERVYQNRVASFKELKRDPETVYDVWQVHSTDVIWTSGNRPASVRHRKADAILTDRSEVTLFMRFADCVPIILHDPVKHVAGLVHAGWLGTVGRIVRETIQAMQFAYHSQPENILAVIGPSIAQHHYEVGSEVIEQVEDAFGEAELLTNLLLADPSDITTQIALAKLLLEHGAYAGAEQLYDLATRNQSASQSLSPSGLLADQAIAHWANGHPDAALGTIRKRQKQMDEIRAAEVQSEEPDLDPRARAEKARERALISPTLATVRAAIQRERGDEDAAESVSRALQAYAQVIRQVRADPEAGEADIARLELEMAWVAVWLSSDSQSTSPLLRAAEQYQPLSEVARARFDGWQALGRRDLAAAVELLEGPAETDPAAGLGLAEAYLQMGRRKDAGRVFLGLARAQPGSLIGVWASNRLARLVGHRMPLSEPARRLEGLIASIPSSFFRYPETPSLAVGLSVEPIKSTFGTFEPAIVNIVVTNNSPHYPLAIDRDGPIRPEVVLEYTTTTPAPSMEGIPTTVVVDIDRRLRLEPLERLVIPVDLRRLPLGNALDEQAAHGMIVRLKATLNATITPRGAVRPMLLGSARWSPTIRIEGVRVDTAWIREAIVSIREPESSDRLTVMGLLARLVGPPRTREEYEVHQHLPPTQVELLVRAGDAFSNAFAGLDGASQAWLLSMTPSGKIPLSVREMVHASDDRLVLLAYLLFHVSGPHDPVLQTALQSSDDLTRRVAERYIEMFRQMSQDGQGQVPPAVPGQRMPPQ